MNILIIDTSSEIEYIAVFADDKLFESSKVSGFSHSSNLMCSIDNVFSSSGITINDVGLVAVGVGPGSWTGIRVAVSTARAVSQTLNIPCLPVSTHEIFAMGYPFAAGDVIVTAFDSKKKRVFASAYLINDDYYPELVISAGDYEPEQLASLIDGRKVFGIGNGFEKYRDYFETLSNITIIGDYIPTGKRIADFALKKFNENPLPNSNYDDIMPVYLRKSDAEILFNV